MPLAWSRLTGLLDHRSSSFIWNMQEHFKQSQKKDTITNLPAISCHIWGNNSAWNTGPDFRHRSCKRSRLLNMAGKVKGSSYQREAWVLGTSSLIYLHFYGGSWFLQRRMISTKEADFYGGHWFERIRLICKEAADFYEEGCFLRRKLISTEKALF